VKNLRSQVAHLAMVCLGELYTNLKKNMDSVSNEPVYCLWYFSSVILCVKSTLLEWFWAEMGPTRTVLEVKNYPRTDFFCALGLEPVFLALKLYVNDKKK